MLSFAEQGLGQGVRPSHAPKVCRSDRCILVETKAVADTIVDSVLADTRVIFRIAETVGKMVNNGVDEYWLCLIEEASTTAADSESSMGRSPSRVTRPSKI